MTSDSKTTATVPRWYQVVAIASLLWNLLGCASFGMQVFAQETMLESATEAVQQWYRSIPGWIYFVFAVAVFLKEPWIFLFSLGVLYVCSLPFSVTAYRKDNPKK